MADSVEHVVPEHYKTAEQAFSASKMGVWLFMVTEILMFGGLFVAYTVFRSLYPDMFHEASDHLDWVLGGVNTVVLIASSFSMAMAVNRVQHDQLKQAGWFLVFTFLCASIFMGVKYVEYSHKIHEGLLPGAQFTYEAIQHPKAPIFFSLYFMMTGLHGVHVLVGMGLIAWIWVRVRLGHFGSSYYTPVELVGIYWHLVDLIWIYLFPLLYLVG